MKALLFCKTGQLAGASFEIQHEATIGKSPGNTIQLYPTLVSGKHARIFYDEKVKSYFVEDLGSRNGTRLDGVRVKGKERLGTLNVITFSNTFDFLFQVVDADIADRQAGKSVLRGAVQKAPLSKPSIQETQANDGFIPLPPAKPDAMKPSQPEDDARQKTMFDDGAFALPSFEENKGAPKQDEGQRTRVGIEFTPVPSFVEPSKPPKQAGGDSVSNYVLVFEGLKGGPIAFDIKAGSTIVGREASCTIPIDDGSISRKHAEFILQGGALTLKDLGSKNHTYIDDQRISKVVDVREGMRLTFGLVKARLVRKPSK